MFDLIKVKGTSKDGKVCSWDRDSRHPDGEVFIAGTDEVEVFPTNAVKAAIKAGTLVEVKPEALEYVVNTIKSAFTPETPVEPEAPTIAAPRQEGAKKRQGA